MSNASFRYVEHVGDVVIEAYGRTLGEAFSNSARALINTVCDVWRVDLHRCVIIQTTGHDQKSLLYNWLEEVLLKLLLYNTALAVFDVGIEQRGDKYYLVGRCKGEDFMVQKHHYKVEVKGITYHGMKISRRKGKHTVRFLIDL